MKLSRFTTGGSRPPRAMRGGRTLIALAVMLASSPITAQTADEHASHHPGGVAATPMPAPGNGTTAGQPRGSPSADPMAAMMKQMMAPAPAATGAAGMAGMDGATAPRASFEPPAACEASGKSQECLVESSGS